ncbi:MAG: glycosyltransferase family 4 protein, partial [Lentisphaeria bacterium]
YHTLADYDAYNPQLTPRRLRWLNWRRRQVYRLATHVIAVSEAARQDAIHSFGIAPEKCHAIPNAMRDPLEEFPELQQASAGATLLEKGDPHTPSQNFCAFAESAGRRCSSDPANNAGGLPADSAKEQKGLTEGLGTAFPKKGVTNICGLLCVGTLHRAKGQDVLLRTMARLTPAFPELRCVFFGDGPAAVELRQLAVELEVADRCHFAGNRPRLEVLQTMQQAAVVVCPSRSEAFGYVLLEAMALGRPVVAAVAGGIPEIVRDGADGRLFPAGDDQALAETLGEVLSHPDDAVRWGDAGRQRFVQQFTLPARLETVTAWLKQKAAMKS